MANPVIAYILTGYLVMAPAGLGSVGGAALAAAVHLHADVLAHGPGVCLEHNVLVVATYWLWHHISYGNISVFVLMLMFSLMGQACA